MAALPPHPNIVGQYRAWQEGGHFYIQMDLCEGGSLHQLVAAVREGWLGGEGDTVCGLHDIQGPLGALLGG